MLIDKENFIELNNFEILDGLQRTHRLKIIWESINFITNIEEEKRINLLDVYRKNAGFFSDLGCDIKLLRSLEKLGCFRLKNADEFFYDINIWVEVWQNLTESQQVTKMLVLNAGHKSVNIKHQLELLFLGTLLSLNNHAPSGVTFVREKEISTTQYSKSRKIGTYHFSHIISALIALSAGKVINTNADYVSELISGKNDQVELMEGFNTDFIEVFLGFLFQLDQVLTSEYGEIGEKWLGREVVIVGFFAALGEYAFSFNLGINQALWETKNKMNALVKALDLNQFEAARNDIELNKVNIGNVNKRAVYSAIHDLLRGSLFKGWSVYFGAKL